MSKKQMIVFFVVMLVITAFAIWKANSIQQYGAVVQAWVTVMLVLLTASYVYSTKKQADASVKMAEEMRAQRRPIVIQEVVPAQGIPFTLAAQDIDQLMSSDSFEIRNVGNSPAIELEILLLDDQESQFGYQKQTFLVHGSETPLTFHPKGLENHLTATCYLLCRYRAVLSHDEAKIWYRTRLPFIPTKSQRGDRIIIKPEELEFLPPCFEKKSY